MRLRLEGLLSPVQRLILLLYRRILDGVPGPVLLVSVKKKFFGDGWIACMAEGMRSARYWTKSETELLAAFVSRCNSCGY
jgi:hypothetical protein